MAITEDTASHTLRSPFTYTLWPEAAQASGTRRVLLLRHPVMMMCQLQRQVLLNNPWTHTHIPAGN